MAQLPIPVRLFDQFRDCFKNKVSETPRRHHAPSPKKVNNMNESKFAKIIASSDSRWYKARLTLGGACIGLQSLHDPVLLF